ncbi:MAG: GDYXXLXY domain-containing protein [Gammaproteobacteria bacterium]|nr:GDYXXLXY domain-containing protein [Gammaproteobacteria bacterium]
MREPVRRALIVVSGLLALSVVHYGVYSRERLLNDGDTVLLRLAPVDPRSMLQGDYMALNFELARAIREALGERDVADGRAVVGVEPSGIGGFRRLDDGRPLAADERLLRYRLRAGRVRLATNAYFFAEGTAHLYVPARYGEFRVAADGDAILTHLRDEHRVRLGEGAGAPRVECVPPDVGC